MRLLTTTLLCALALLAGKPACAQAATPMPPAGAMRDITSLALSKQLSPGWNLGNTLEAVGSPTPPPWNSDQTNETLWGNPKASQALMDSVKAAGFKFVRIPVSWTQYADAHHTISPKWMARVAEVVGYARNAGLVVMINVHWDGGWMNHLTYDQQAALNAKLAKFWTQIATHFKDHDDHLLFAGQNETHVPNAPEPPTAEALAVQNSFNQTFVNTVRATGGNNARRHLVVQTYNTNIGIGHDSFVMPSDTVADRLFVEVHYYDPYKMTLVTDSPVYQWGSASTQAEGAWATEARIDADFQKMKKRFVDKGVPVILGEYGAISKTEHDPAGVWRKKWAQFVTRSAVQHGLVPVWWDDGSTGNHTFGLFDRKTGAQGHPDLIKTIIDASK
jgi:endoglucanase